MIIVFSHHYLQALRLRQKLLRSDVVSFSVQHIERHVALLSHCTDDFYSDHWLNFPHIKVAIFLFEINK